MGKRFTKIICLTVSAIAVVGAAFSAGCSNYYKSNPLSTDGVFTDTPAVSNGGFAVEKGNYVYFINGVEANTALNDYGAPVKGAIYRVSKTDLKNRDYSSAECVIPQVAYTADYKAGIFVYGDRIYYGTPSTAKNSEGAVQNSNLDMKSAKLDGTEAMKNAYVQFPSTSYEYRFVEAGEDDTVYLMYVATSEKLYDESTGVNNLHSYNTATGEDTLLAYNVSNVTFDAEDKTNPRVYYTMGVKNYATSSNYGYNQLYTVTADATEDKFKDKLGSENVTGWNDETDRYINCGDLVLDGVGKKDVNGADKSPLNHEPDNKDAVNELSYTYSPVKYTNGTLFYTRTTSNNSGAYLFSIKDGIEREPIDNNPAAEKRLLSDGSKAKDYEYLFENGELSAVLIAEGEGISINKVSESGKLSTELGIASTSGYFKIVKSGTATLLWTDTANHLLYYSVSVGNGLTLNRVDYTGNVSDYEPLAAGETNYTPVKILDLDASSTWFKPEVISNYLLFASETTNMTSYNYVMVFDMNTESGLMTNAEIRELTKQFEGIEKIIDKTFGDTDKYPTKLYANLQNALRYAFYTGEGEYIKELAELVNADLEKDADPVYSEQTLALYAEFLAPADGNAWADYKDSKTVNGVKVYANNRDYYYSVLGEMSEADAEAYANGLKTAYLVAEPAEEDNGWYAGLSTGAKAGFIVGMCAAGLLVLGGAAVLVIWLVRRSRRIESGEPKRKRIKIDTTDDKDIDVYAVDESEAQQSEATESVAEDSSEQE